MIFDPPLPDGCEHELRDRDIPIGYTVSFRLPRPFVVPPDPDEWLDIDKRRSAGEKLSQWEQLQWEEGPLGSFVSPVENVSRHTRIA